MTIEKIMPKPASAFDDTHILAMTAYGENRGGGKDGMQSVLNVICNRANHPSWWGRSLRDVCLKPEQFDCWNPEDPNYKIITTVDDANAVFRVALELARQAVAFKLDDITNGATYYYAQTISKAPYWAVGHNPCTTVAGQLFFNDVG